MIPPEYSIVIPTYGARGVNLLARMLPILSYSCKLPHEVIVVDDGSPKDVIEELDKICIMNNAKLLHDDENQGFAKACNAGMQMCNGNSTILCNNDIMPIGDTFDCLSDTVRMPGVGLASCKLLYPDERIQHAGVCWVDPSKIPTEDGKGFLEGPGWFDHLFRFGHRQDIRASRMDYRLCSGALLAINIGLIQTVGYLDERFGMAAEDIDYNLRCIECGQAIMYNGHIEAFHLEGATRGNTAEGKARHPEWTQREAQGLKFLFEKWAGINWANFRQEN